MQQQQLEDLVGLLHGVQPFAGLTREQVTSLAIFVRPLEVPKDQVIVKQGDAVDAFYLIKSGVSCCSFQCRNVYFILKTLSLHWKLKSQMLGDSRNTFLHFGCLLPHQGRSVNKRK